jgi:hypothetical protein
MAFVQISSHFLAHVGPEKAEQVLQDILGQLGNLTSAANVNRIDLFADFVYPDSKEWSRDAWVTRAAGIDQYSENGIFTGWVVGKGGQLLGRMYYKLLQAVKTGLDYLLPVWEKGGWLPDEHVWRLEFQIKREVLKQMGIDRLSDTLNNLCGLWCYATTEWLKLTIPNPDDQTRSRWPIHPLWSYLSSIDWEAQGGPLLREYNPARAPQDEQLYVRYFSPLISYMAIHGVDDLFEAGDAITEEAIAYFTRRAEYMGLPLDGYIAERVALKRREFNTGINDPELAEKIAAEELERKAQAYRKARDD